MQTTNNDLKEHVTRFHRFNFTVIGRKSKKTSSIPIWFVLEAKSSARAAPTRSGTRTCSRIRRF
jgi:hypothetical protein